MKTFQINDTIEIVCESQNTRNGFRHVATLLYNGADVESTKIVYSNRTWERFEFESVLERLADKSTVLSKDEKDYLNAYIKNYDYRQDSPFKTVALIAELGNVFGKTQEEKNSWKARMLKAGLGNKGLDLPEDWDELSEEDKETRLNGAIAQLK